MVKTSNFTTIGKFGTQVGEIIEPAPPEPIIYKTPVILRNCWGFFMPKIQFIGAFGAQFISF